MLLCFYFTAFLEEFNVNTSLKEYEKLVFLLEGHFIRLCCFAYHVISILIAMYLKNSKIRVSVQSKIMWEIKNSGFSVFLSSSSCSMWPHFWSMAIKIPHPLNIEVTLNNLSLHRVILLAFQIIQITLKWKPQWKQSKITFLAQLIIPYVICQFPIPWAFGVVYKNVSVYHIEHWNQCYFLTFITCCYQDSIKEQINLNRIAHLYSSSSFIMLNRWLVLLCLYAPCSKCYNSILGK